MAHIYDSVVIGGGPAGYAAALYLARAGLDALVIEKMAAGGQMAETGIIENYPGFDEGIDGFTLGMRMQAGAERFGAVTEYGEVRSVELSGEIKRIITSDRELLARTVVVATGAAPRKLGLEKESELLGRGVHYCAHCDGRFYKGKTAAVIGGGNSAVSDALYLSRLLEKVYLIHRRDSLRASKVYHERLMHAENIEILWNSTVSAIKGDERLSSVTVKGLSRGDYRELMLDAVFVSIGREPSTHLFSGQLAVDDDGYIIADEGTRTNIPGVFAVGDVRTKELRQVVTAVSDGAVAAHQVEKYLSV